MNNVVNNIHQVFKDYFGEENIDLQEAPECYYIIVFWESVTITNEYDESVDIQHLYARISIDKSTGKLLDKPRFMRSQYSEVQWNSGYVHSHIPAMYRDNITTWKGSCLGSGPINHTIAKLSGKLYNVWNEQSHDYTRMDYSTQRKYTDMMVWTLFAFELDKYVHVESVAGTPHFRMSQIGSSSNSRNTAVNLRVVHIYNPETFFSDHLEDFLVHIINKKLLKFSYEDGNFILGMSSFDAILTISNAFIEWYNSDENARRRITLPVKTLYHKDILQKVFAFGNNLYSERTATYSLPSIVTKIGMPLGFMFKGEEVTLSIHGVSKDSELNTVTILDPDIIGHLIYRVLRFVNYKYGKSTDKINQKVRIL